MAEALNRLINYFSKGDNYDKLLWIIIGLFIGAIFSFMKSQLVNLLKFTWRYIKKLVRIFIEKIKCLLKYIDKKIKYRLNIRKIEKGEMEIPPYFLVGKTYESNPELTKIFNLIDEGVIEESVQSKLARHLEKNPIDWDEVLSSQKDLINKNMHMNTPHPTILKISSLMTKNRR